MDGMGLKERDLKKKHILESDLANLKFKVLSASSEQPENLERCLGATVCSTELQVPLIWVYASKGAGLEVDRNTVSLCKVPLHSSG